MNKLKNSPVRRVGIVLAILSGLLTSNAKAGDYAVSFSPFHLFSPIVEVLLEVPLSKDVSASGILGYGSITVQDGLSKSVKVSIFEAGGQFRYYTAGDMNRGLHLGVEGMYIKPGVDEEAGVTVDSNGFAVGPLVGYKWSTQSGNVLDLQLVYQWLFAQTKAKNSLGDELDESVRDNVTTLNINFGFSF